MTINPLNKPIMENKNVDSATSSEDEVESDGDSNDFQNENVRWADSIAKILKTNKSKGKKTLVLSKGKKISEAKVKKPQKLEFEVETLEGEIKRDIVIEKDEDTEEVNKLPERKKKRELPILRKKPNILHKDRERTLCKIATKGVVQLFNAIKTQQTDTNNKLEQAGSLEVKRNKVLKSVDKRAFLDMLMQERSENVPAKEAVMNNKNGKKEKSWNVLRDDFMIGAKLKDWDKETEKEEEMEYE